MRYNLEEAAGYVKLAFKGFTPDMFPDFYGVDEIYGAWILWEYIPISSKSDKATHSYYAKEMQNWIYDIQVKYNVYFDAHSGNIARTADGKFKIVDIGWVDN